MTKNKSIFWITFKCLHRTIFALSIDFGTNFTNAFPYLELNTTKNQTRPKNGRDEKCSLLLTEKRAFWSTRLHFSTGRCWPLPFLLVDVNHSTFLLVDVKGIIFKFYWLHFLPYNRSWKMLSTPTIAHFLVDLNQAVLFHWLTVHPHWWLTLIDSVDAVDVHFYCNFHHAP